MKNTTKILTTAVVAALGLFGAGPTTAGAATVSATLSNVTDYQAVHIYFDGHGESYTAAGRLQWQGTAANGPMELRNAFSAFCIDFAQGLDYGQTYTFDFEAVELAPEGGPNPAGGMGAQRADAIRQLWGMHYGDLGTSATNVAAFQMALWEIIHETAAGQPLSAAGLDLSSGRFYATDGGAATTTANAYLASLFDGGALRTDQLAMNLYALTSPTAQDQLVHATVPLNLIPPPTAAVPLPSAALGGLGLMGLTLVQSGRRRRVAAEQSQ